MILIKNKTVFINYLLLFLSDIDYYTVLSGYRQDIKRSLRKNYTGIRWFKKYLILSLNYFLLSVSTYESNEPTDAASTPLSRRYLRMYVASAGFTFSSAFESTAY